ncbi:hypothetical protein Tco_1033438 [Tanacetum coccineum]
MSFGNTKKLKAYPEFGTNFLSTSLNRSHTLCVAAHSPFKISEEQQFIAIKFAANQTRLQEQLLGELEELGNEEKWVRFHGDFKIHLKVTRKIAVPDSHIRIYFDCKVLFKDVSSNEIGKDVKPL